MSEYEKWPSHFQKPDGEEEISPSPVIPAPLWKALERKEEKIREWALEIASLAIDIAKGDPRYISNTLTLIEIDVEHIRKEIG